jgi:hypothetical protein
MIAANPADPMPMEKSKKSFADIHAGYRSAKVRIHPGQLLPTATWAPLQCLQGPHRHGI